MFAVQQYEACLQSCTFERYFPISFPSFPLFPENLFLQKTRPIFSPHPDDAEVKKWWWSKDFFPKAKKFQSFVYDDDDIRLQ